MTTNCDNRLFRTSYLQTPDSKLLRFHLIQRNMLQFPKQMRHAISRCKQKMALSILVTVRILNFLKDFKTRTSRLL